MPFSSLPLKYEVLEARDPVLIHLEEATSLKKF